MYLVEVLARAGAGARKECRTCRGLVIMGLLLNLFFFLTSLLKYSRKITVKGMATGFHR